MKQLAGKVALVTGAGSGIGLGIATALAQAGVKVMLCDIQQDALDRVLADLRATNADVSAVRADVSLKDELRAAADATLAAYLRDPKADMPGTKKIFAGIKQRDQLIDVIAYLKEATK